MFADDEQKKTASNEILLGCDLSTFSIEDIDERIVMLQAEVERLRQEKQRKSSHLDAAQAFFKKI